MCVAKDDGLIHTQHAFSLDCYEVRSRWSWIPGTPQIVTEVWAAHTGLAAVKLDKYATLHASHIVALPHSVQSVIASKS